MRSLDTLPRKRHHRWAIVASQVNFSDRESDQQLVILSDRKGEEKPQKETGGASSRV